MALDLSPLIPIYQESISQIIEQMGKNVTIYFEQQVTGVNNKFYDQVTGNASRKPDFKGTNVSSPPITSQPTSTIKALIRINPKEFQSYGIQIQKPEGIIRLKTYLRNVPDLLRCSYIVPNSDSRDILETKYALIREPLPVGLQQDFFAISYWQRI